MGRSIRETFNLLINGETVRASQLPAWAMQHAEDEQDYVRSLARFLTEWLNTDAELTVKTSGSTGKPKEQRVAKMRMEASAKATNAFFKLGPGSTALLALSTDYIAGKMMVVRALVGGYALRVVAPGKNPLANVKEPVDFAPLVPLQAQAGLQHLSKVRNLLLGGAPVTELLRHALVNAAGKTRIFQSYGMTETLSHVALRELTASEISYTCLPGVTVHTGEGGNLVIHAPGIADGVVETNDAAKVHSSHTFEWLGRLDFVINSGGVKIHPEAVEEKLAPHINVPFFIHHKPHAELGEAVILILERTAVNHEIPESTFEELHPYERPKEVHSIPRFMYTDTGKIKREATAKLLWNT